MTSVPLVYGEKQHKAKIGRLTGGKSDIFNFDERPSNEIRPGAGDGHKIWGTDGDVQGVWIGRMLAGTRPGSSRPSAVVMGRGARFCSFSALV